MITNRLTDFDDSASIASPLQFQAYQKGLYWFLVHKGQGAEENVFEPFAFLPMEMLTSEKFEKNSESLELIKYFLNSQDGAFSQQEDKTNINNERIPFLINRFLDCADINENFKLGENRNIELSIVMRMKKIDKVQAIYSQKHRAEMQIIVFLNTINYDNEIMDKILDIEYDLQQTYRDLYLAFTYVQGIHEDRKEVVHPKSKLIYVHE